MATVGPACERTAVLRVFLHTMGAFSSGAGSQGEREREKMNFILQLKLALLARDNKERLPVQLLRSKEVALSCTES